MLRSMHLSSRFALGFAFVGVLTSGCTADAVHDGTSSDVTNESPDLPPVKPPFDPGTPIPDPTPGTLVCQPDIVVEPNSRAFIVTDPEVLARFSLERVLQQIIDRAPRQTTPLTMLQQLFDTQNSTATGVFPEVVHCDDPKNLAFQFAPAASCPRAEGALAKSSGFFDEGHPDHFVPIALVNRFDLTPRQGFNCGEHRIMYAKWSGRTNPQERVFLAFEGILSNINGIDTIQGCRPVAQQWASLAKETDVQVVADRLEELYFTGISGFAPVVSPEHYALAHHDNDDGGGGYGDKTGTARFGQVRLSQGMQEPWEFREFHVHFSFDGENRPPLFFGPVTTKNSPRPELFDPASSLSDGAAFRAQFLQELPALASKQNFGIQFAPANPIWNAGESMISSDPSMDFVSRAFAGEPGQTFWSQIQAAMTEQKMGSDCAANEPLRPEDLVRRVSMLTCAGCHAPEQYLGADRAMGCGQTWPLVSQRAHIDEFSQLSPALTESFLPRRAEVLSLYLQGCDIEAIQQNLEPAEKFGGGGIPPK